MKGFDFSEKNELEEEIFQMYKKEINPDRCDICNEYDLNLKEKLTRCSGQSFWHMGKNLSKKIVKQRIVFVGKNSWSTHDDLEDENDLFIKKPKFYDCRDMGPAYFYFPKNYNYSHYWENIKYIVNKLNLTLEDIAITNLVKCNIYYEPDPDSYVITPPKYFKNCIDILEEEIKLIKPTHVILLTGKKYDDLIEKLRFGYKKDPIDIFSKTKKVINSNDKYSGVPWWTRKFVCNDKNMYQLRTRHPQGAPSGLKDAIYEWIKNPDKT